jgi:hypothetical protein
MGFPVHGFSEKPQPSESRHLYGNYLIVSLAEWDRTQGVPLGAFLCRLATCQTEVALNVAVLAPGQYWPDSTEKSAKLGISAMPFGGRI